MDLLIAVSLLSKSNRNTRHAHRLDGRHFGGAAQLSAYEAPVLR